MIRYIKRNILLFLGCCIATIACTPMDAYRDFVPNGEITYTGKVDSIKTFSGNGRVVIQGLLTSDPRIVQVGALWNDYRDTLMLDVVRSENVDTILFEIDNLEENTWNFILKTYDEEGNTSVPVYAIAQAYGARYISTLSNRYLSTPIYEGGVLTAEWAEADYLSNLLGTEFVYVNAENEEVLLWKDPSANDKLIEISDYKVGTTIKYRSLYIPDETCVDTFYTAYDEVAVLSLKNVTSTYLKNYASPIQYATYDGKRWGTLADWKFTNDIKTTTDGLYGGFEMRSGVGCISLEAGWGLKACPNGKIYQTMTLPAGDYRFQINVSANGSAGTKYMVVSKGTELPDFTAVLSSSIAFADISAGVISFTLEEESEVSIGFVCNLPGNGEYAKISNVSLWAYVEE